MSRQMDTVISRSDIISAVPLLCGVVLLFTSRYRLSIFFITTLILFQLLHQIIQAGVKELTFSLSKGTVSAKMLEKKEDLKQEVAEYFKDEAPKDIKLHVHDGVKATDEIRLETDTISQKVQDSIDEAFMFGYKAAGGRGEISNVSIDVNGDQKVVSWTEAD